MSDFNELLQTIKKAAKEAVESSNPCGVLFGTVVSTNPLQINVEQKMTLSKEFLILTKNVVDYTVDVTINWTTENTSLNANHSHNTNVNSNISVSSDISPNEDNQKITNTVDGNIDVSVEQKNINLTHKHSINGTKSMTVHNALKTGDKVTLIQVQGGQKYVVLDKVY